MVGAASLAGSALSGCGTRASFEDPDPSTQLAALNQAIEANDRSKIPDMIELLDSDDPAVRMFAILGLERMTGQTLGYDFAAPEAERDAATERWVEWYTGRGSDGADRDGEGGGGGGA